MSVSKNKNEIVFVDSAEKIAYTGRVFNPNNDRWEIDANRAITLDHLHELDEQTSNSARNALSFFAQRRSADYTYGLSYSLSLYIDETESDVINITSLLNFKASLSKSELYKFGVLRALLKKWYQLGYPGVNREIIDFIYQFKISGNKKGAAVKSLDPEKGPYSDIEFEAIRFKLDQFYAEGRVSLEEIVLSSLVIESGRRGIQISFLRIKDFVIDVNTLEQPFYSLNIPRAKQRNSSFRGQFKQFAMNEVLGCLTELYIEEMKETLFSKLKNKLTKDEFLELPLFPNVKMLFELDNSELLVEALPSRELHRKSSLINELLVYTVKKLGIISERTSEPLKISCVRFRYTLGTRASREGYGKSIIAELLDHNDDQNADVYTKNVPDKGAKISSFMDVKLIKFAEAFQGRIVLKEKDAIRGGDISSRIQDDNGKNIATCGSFGDCYENAPVACYLCKKFQPWLDAPHKLILKKLVDEREEIEKITNDQTISSINDRAIIAVMQVIKMCSERKMLGRSDAN
ncbi:MAG: site-specific integrase [Colwellia sp.]